MLDGVLKELYQLNKRGRDMDNKEYAQKIGYYVAEKMRFTDDAAISFISCKEEDTMAEPQEKVYIVTKKALEEMMVHKTELDEKDKAIDEKDQIIEELFEMMMAQHVGCEPKRIVKSGNRTIVFWGDAEKTIVKRCDGDEDSEYAAFAAAFVKHYFGSNSAIRKMLAEKTEYQKEKKGKNTNGSEE